MEEYTMEDGFFVWKGRRYASLDAMTSAMRMIPTAEPYVPWRAAMLNELTAVHEELGLYKEVPTAVAGGTDVSFEEFMADTELPEGGIHPQGGDSGGVHPKDGADDGSKGTRGGIKNDAGKSRVDLLPSSALLEIGKVMEFGARKYAPNNWRKGFDWSRLYGAALRHLLAHKDGESTDKETGLSHLAHASCCLLFLLTHELEGLGNDDRPTM